MKPLSQEQWISLAKEVLEIERDSIHAQMPRLNADFVRACEIIRNTKGHLIIAGIGKSGHIGAKLAATFASTGTPSFFVHPTEAGHGDLGMITKYDTLLALSYSGESQEIMTMIPYARNLGGAVISITANPTSSMAKASDVALILDIEREACPLGFAPTSSSIATLALGDAMAIAIMQSRDFSADDFARSHPFGRLGRRLCTKVSQVMHQEGEMPRNLPSDTVHEALFQITDRRLGMTLIADGDTLLGIYTDGDLRRTLARFDNALLQTLADVMTKNPTTVSSDMLAYEALQIMQQKQITVLPVVDEGRLVGVVHIHDLLSCGIV